VILHYGLIVIYILGDTLKYIIRILAFAFALMGGCEELIQVGGIGPEINFQEGTIQGVRTGDDTSTVVQNLG